MGAPGLSPPRPINPYRWEAAGHAGKHLLGSALQGGGAGPQGAARPQQDPIRADPFLEGFLTTTRRMGQDGGGGDTGSPQELIPSRCPPQPTPGWGGRREELCSPRCPQILHGRGGNGTGGAAPRGHGATWRPRRGGLPPAAAGTRCRELREEAARALPSPKSKQAAGLGPEPLQVPAKGESPPHPGPVGAAEGGAPCSTHPNL